MHNTRCYWAFGLCPSSGVLKNTKEHDVSGNGSVSSSGEGWETPPVLGQLERANLNQYFKRTQQSRCLRPLI
jgi:hypothetical protein